MGLPNWLLNYDMCICIFVVYIYKDIGISGYQVSGLVVQHLDIWISGYRDIGLSVWILGYRDIGLSDW